MQTHTLTTGNITQQILSMTYPMILGILSIMSMNIVDTFYIAQLGTQELAAMSFTLPINSTLLSLAFGIGIGASSLVSRSIGANQQDFVQVYATNALIIALCVGLCFAIFGYLFTDTLFLLLGAEDSLIPLIREYMDIWFLGSFVVMIPMVGNSTIRAAGNTTLPGLVMLSVAIINLVLDPILIFGLLGFPELGLKGAAIATVLSYGVALLMGCYIMTSKFNFINLSLALNHLKTSWINILKLAIPAIGTNLIAPLSVACTTWFVAKYSAEAVAGFGVASRVEAIFLVIIMSLSSVMGPFVGQNWGAKQPERAFQGIETALKLILIWSIFIAVILWIFAEPISLLFSQDPDVVASSSSYLRLLPISYFLLGTIMVLSSTANGMGTPVPSLIMSFFRLLGLYIPLVLVLMLHLNVTGIYLAASLANILVGIGALIWYKNLKKNHHLT